MSAESGGLWARVAEVGRAAQASGALRPLETHQRRLEDQGVVFQVRELTQLRDKPRASSKSARNPFLPYEPGLFVAEFGASHVALLNKYNVVDQHLLLVTRRFASQTTLLNQSDFSVASRALSAGPGLLFYNAGDDAGASQPHRHLQLVPLPLSADAGGFPLAEMLFSGKAPFSVRSRTSFSDESCRRASQWYRFYREQVAALGLQQPGSNDLRPYNLLLSTTGMAIVPRTCEGVDGLSVNALGFAGLLLVQNHTQYRQLREIGPLALLRHCATVC